MWLQFTLFFRESQYRERSRLSVWKYNNMFSLFIQVMQTACLPESLYRNSSVAHLCGIRTSLECMSLFWEEICARLGNYEEATRKSRVTRWSSYSHPQFINRSILWLYLLGLDVWFEYCLSDQALRPVHLQLCSGLESPQLFSLIRGMWAILLHACLLTVYLTRSCRTDESWEIVYPSPWSLRTVCLSSLGLPFSLTIALLILSCLFFLLLMFCDESWSFLL